eukprot:SAG11_NODE_19584_length_463_cov_1.692308_1_plen_44_part_10
MSTAHRSKNAPKFISLLFTSYRKVTLGMAKVCHTDTCNMKLCMY